MESNSPAQISVESTDSVVSNFNDTGVHNIIPSCFSYIKWHRIPSLKCNCHWRWKRNLAMALQPGTKSRCVAIKERARCCNPQKQISWTQQVLAFPAGCWTIRTLIIALDTKKQMVSKDKGFLLSFCLCLCSRNNFALCSPSSWQWVTRTVVCLPSACIDLALLITVSVQSAWMVMSQRGESSLKPTDDRSTERWTGKGPVRGDNESSPFSQIGPLYWSDPGDICAQQHDSANQDEGRWEGGHHVPSIAT